MSSGIHIPVTADYKGFVDSMNAVKKSVKSTMDQVEESGMSIEQMLNRIKNAAALSFAGFSGAKLIKDIASVRGEFQQLEVAFSTMLGSEEKATDLMNQLVKTAAITPFDLKGVADGAKSLMAYGTAAEDVNETLVRLGDIAAGMSIPLNDLVYLYGTTMVQGRMFTQDLRQFQGRGIPIAEELAKVLQTTKDQIPDLVTAGKVTAEVFNQAIVNMTEAGSKFGGLMEKQSKTINGQISNIEDAIDMMFNDIGKSSEGIINGALGTVSFLVENYETLGKVLVDCAVAFGTYKTAVMVVSAIQAAQTAGLGALTAAETLHYSWLVLCEKAQALLNKTMLANPYVLVATAVTTLVATMYMFNSEAKGMGDSISEANSKVEKSFAEVDAKIKTEQNSIDDLFNRLRKAEKGTNEYKEAKDAILKQYGSYLNGLSEEIRTLQDVEGAYKKVAAAARDAALARGKEAALSKANTEYSQSYSEAIGKIYDILSKNINEQNANKAIGIIKKDLKDLGYVAEDTQRTLHKYGVDFSLFGDLNNAEQALITSTNKINALFGEQKEEVKETAENVTTLSQDYKAAEKSYKIAKNWFEQIEKNKNDYTTAEYTKAKDDLKAAKDAFEKVGGKVDKKTGGQNDTRKRHAAQIIEETRYQEELTDLQVKAIDARRDAIIAAIANDSEREAAEQDEQHKRRLRQIQKEADEMKKAVYEHNKAVWENSHKDSPYELTPEGKAGWSAIQLSKEQQEIINTETEKENVEYNRLVEQRYVNEAQEMLDFLKQYGTYEQKKLAITEEYERKIADAKKKGRNVEAMRLQEEMNSQLGSSKAQELSRGIDFSQVVKGLSSMVDTIGKETYKKISEYRQTDEYKDSSPESKQAIADLEKKLVDAGYAGSISPFNTKAWDDINKHVEAYDTAIKKLTEVTGQHNKDVEALRKAQEKLKKVYAGGNITEIAAASAEVMQAETQANQSGEEKKKAQSTVDSTGQVVKNDLIQVDKGLQDFNTVLGQVTSGSLTGFTLAVGNIIKQLSGDDDIAENIGDLFGDLGKDIGGIIGAILSIIDALGEDPAGFIDSILSKVANVIEAVISQIPQIIMTIIKGAGNIVAGIGKGILGLFGDFFGADNHEEMLKLQDKYNRMIDTSTNALNRFTEELEKSYGVMAIKNAEGAEEMIRKNMETIVKGIDSVLTDNYGGGHSDYYHANKALNWVGGDLQNAGLIQFLQSYGINPYEEEQGHYTWQQIFRADPETLARMFKDMRDQMPDLWRIVTTEMGANDGALQEWIEKLIDAYDQIGENSKRVMEQITTTTEDEVFDSFMDSLYDLADGSKDVFDDIADNWQKMVNKMVVNNLVGESMRKNLSDWYNKLAEANNKRLNMEINDDTFQAELNTLKAEYEGYIKSGQEQIEQFRSMGIISSVGSVNNDKSATMSLAEKVTYDQMEEFTGILTSVQIAGQQRLDIQKQILYTLQTMSGITSPDNSDVREIRSLLGISNDYLLDIRRSNRSILDGVTERMDRIIDKLNNM